MKKIVWFLVFGLMMFAISCGDSWPESAYLENISYYLNATHKEGNGGTLRFNSDGKVIYYTNAENVYMVADFDYAENTYKGIYKKRVDGNYSVSEISVERYSGGEYYFIVRAYQ